MRGAHSVFAATAHTILANTFASLVLHESSGGAGGAGGDSHVHAQLLRLCAQCRGWFDDEVKNKEGGGEGGKKTNRRAKKEGSVGKVEPGKDGNSEEEVDEDEDDDEGDEAATNERFEEFLVTSLYLLLSGSAIALGGGAGERTSGRVDGGLVFEEVDMKQASRFLHSVPLQTVDTSTIASPGHLSECLAECINSIGVPPLDCWPWLAKPLLTQDLHTLAVCVCMCAGGVDGVEGERGGGLGGVALVCLAKLCQLLVEPEATGLYTHIHTQLDMSAHTHAHTHTQMHVQKRQRIGDTHTHTHTHTHTLPTLSQQQKQEEGE